MLIKNSSSNVEPAEFGTNKLIVKLENLNLIDKVIKPKSSKQPLQNIMPEEEKPVPKATFIIY
jgi:hypothetical protein